MAEPNCREAIAQAAVGPLFAVASGHTPAVGQDPAPVKGGTLLIGVPGV